MQKLCEVNKKKILNFSSSDHEGPMGNCVTIYLEGGLYSQHILVRSQLEHLHFFGACSKLRANI